MEEKGELQNSGVMKGDEVPETYRISARSEKSMIPFGDSTTPAAPAVVAPPEAVKAPSETPVSGAMMSTEVKKKRGRPRKYGPDGALALFPMPVSAANPLLKKKKHKLEFGEGAPHSVGANFTPHVITVNAGEDVSVKILSFSQQGSRAISILAANGSISNVTLCQPTSSGGTLTYEGRFEILSLSGSFMPSDSGGTESRTGGMSVLLAGLDGRVMGGALAGSLVAAGPVQVVVGSFLPGHQQQKSKKLKVDLSTPFSPVPIANRISGEGTDAVYTGANQSIAPASYHGDDVASGNTIHDPTINHASNHENNMASGSTVHGRNITPAPYQGEEVGSGNATHGQSITLAQYRGENEGSENATPIQSIIPASCHGDTPDSGNDQTRVTAETNISFPTNSKDPSPSNCMVSC